MERIGEVIEASTQEFLAQSYELHQAPPFGSLVKVGPGEGEIYGVVYHVTTRSIEPGRQPLAWGRDEEREEDVYRRNPQLEKLLRTEFQTLILGFSRGGQVCRYLPPSPPRVHSFVYPCSNQEVGAFTAFLDFLPFLLSNRGLAYPDELVAALLRQAYEARSKDQTFLVAAGKELAILLSKEPQRLNALLRRIKP